MENFRRISMYKASETDRNFFKISPSGYGVHWPSLDEDLSIGGLIANRP